MVEYNISGGVVFAGSRILMPVAVATVLPSAQQTVLGTVAVSTLQSPVTVNSGTITPSPGSYAFVKASGTIKPASGILYSVLVAGETGIAGASGGTLLVLDGPGTIAVVPVASGGFQAAQFGPGGVNFASLFASLMGSIDATFVYM